MILKNLITYDLDCDNIVNALVLFLKENDQIATNVIARLMNDSEGRFIISAARYLADQHNEEVKANLQQRQEEIDKIRNS